MVQRVQTLRSSVKGSRPTAREPGELYVNFADRQIGYADAAKVSTDLVAVRYFATTADYAVGDYVVQGGVIYRAKVAITAGAFNAANWDALVTTSGSAGAFVAKGGDTMTGGLTATALASGSTVAAGGGSFVGSPTVVVLGPNTGGTSTGIVLRPTAYSDVTGQIFIAPNGGATLSGNLIISKASPFFILDKPASGSAAALVGRTNGAYRWIQYLGYADGESGANAGSAFRIERYDDSGALIDAPLIISRATGIVDMPKGLTTVAPTMPKMTGGVDTTTNWNSLTPGWWPQALSGGSSGGNGPGTGFFFVQTMFHLTGYVTQVAYPAWDASWGTWTRSCNNTVWSAWSRLDTNIVETVVTTTQAWTKQAGLKFMFVEGVGAGGGGGNAGPTSAGQYTAGSGGGAGGYGRRLFTAAELPASLTITIGAGGAGNTAGGSTTFGALATISGGNPGAQAVVSSGTVPTAAAGGSGGGATGFTANFVGGAGSPAVALAISSGFSQRGAGGDSQFSAGGRGYYALGAAGGIPGDSGGGGSGANNPPSSGSTQTGGTGGNAVIILTEYY